MHLEDYTGLAVGDVIELSTGTPDAEVVVVQRFGYIYLVSATRNGHPVGAHVRRLVEGTGVTKGTIFDAVRTRQVRSRTGAGMPTSEDPDLDGFESHGSWSPRQRTHQLSRFRRRQRATKLQAKQMPAQPNLLVSVKQPERVDLEHWPTLPNHRPCLQNTYASWRILTDGGDHAENYLRGGEGKGHREAISRPA